MVLHVVREGTAEFLVFVRLDISVDDFVVQASSNYMDFVAVFGCRECKGGAHHTGSDNGNLSFHKYF